MITFFVGAALAGPPPFRQIDQIDSYDGCFVRMGEIRPDGVQPLRAECHWPDVSVEAVHRVVRRYERSGDFIECMKQAKVIREEPAGALVWQLDVLGYGLDVRESQTWNTDTDLVNGCVITWKRSDEPFTPQPGHIEMPTNEGAWWFTAASDGGVDLVQDLTIDPGGSLPIWVVNWFQRVGLCDELRRLHALSAAT